MDLNNNNNKQDGGIKKPKLRRNDMQLTDKKKEGFGFDINQSVIDVEECGYGISYGDSILCTYGIYPCCGLVLYDENVRALFHLDWTLEPEDVIKITDKINFGPDVTVVVAPGVACGMPCSFDYKQLEKAYQERGYKVMEKRIPLMYGFVTVGLDEVTIGSALDRSMDQVFEIPKIKPFDINYNHPKRR